MTGYPPPPKWLVWSAVLVVVAGCALTVYGAMRIGVSVDEGFHVVRLRNFLAHGWYLLDDDLDGGQPGSWVGDRWVYAPVTTLILHALNVVCGNESVGQVSGSASAYTVRHLGVAAIGLWGVVAAAAITRRLMGSWRWGLIGAAVLLAIPMWSGHAMFNVKDTPAATGYTLVTLGCVIAWQSRRVDRRQRVLAAMTVTAGLLLAIGTRPALWPGPVAALGMVGLASLWARAEIIERSWWRCADLAVAFLAAMVVLAVIYPSVFAHPWQWMTATAGESATAGATDSGRAYVPVMVMCTVPIALLLCGITGLVSDLLSWMRTRSPAFSVPLLLVISQTMLIPVLAVVKSAPLTGLLRHLLFACPSAAILLTIGIAATFQTQGGRVSRFAIGGTLALGLVTPTIVQIQLFPVLLLVCQRGSRRGAVGLCTRLLAHQLSRASRCRPEGRVHRVLARHHDRRHRASKDETGGSEPPGPQY